MKLYHVSVFLQSNKVLFYSPVGKWYCYLYGKLYDPVLDDDYDDY